MSWTSVANLSVILESGQNSCGIYGNGQNMVGVAVNITPTDDQGNVVDVDEATLRDKIRLIDYCVLVAT